MFFYVPAAGMRASLIHRFGFLLVALIWATLSCAAPAPVAVLAVNGAISPVVADYAVRGIAQAAADGAQLIVLTMDTPGGLDTAMRVIIKSMLASSVPVAAFVAPSGARAASAGTFILMASHVAAMAPGTNLGAATPVALGARSGQADASHEKAVNDAAAYIRSLARLRGRNAEWAEQAVRRAASLPAEDALKQKAIDLLARDVPDLLHQLDRRRINLPDRQVQLRLSGAPVQSVLPDWRTRTLAVMTDPGMAALLMLVGVAGLFLELSNPGLILPGVLGGIALLMGLLALQLLPVHFAGLALVVLGIGFVVTEAFLPSGFLGVGGVIAFVLGAMILMQAGVPGYGLSLPFVAFVAVVVAVFIAWMGGVTLRSWRRAPSMGDVQLIGAVAQIIDDTPGNSWVFFRGERWRVRSALPLVRGQQVRVLARHALVLEVQPADEAANQQ